jgi:predicted ribosomally synthesized peptide with nif11-like leader
MSEEAARAAAERMQDDEEFRGRVLSTPDLDARLAVLVEAGYDCTSAELEARTCALTDEALDLVTGAGVGGGEHHIL